MTPKRLRPLQSFELPAGPRVFVARSPRARLLGLAFLPDPPAAALLLPRCRSVHTFGMRFTLDVAFLDAGGEPLRVARGVPPGRLLGCRGAAAALEAPSGIIPAVEGRSRPVETPAPSRGKLAAALDPRRPIYRDRYNEYFVFILSATGASVLVPVLLLIVNAITGIWALGVFVAASVALELLLIFGLARPQMKPMERGGWALLWGGTAAVLAFCFWELVVDPVL